MTLGEMNGKTRRVRLPDGEVTEVYKVDYNIAFSVRGIVQCCNGIWIKARNLTVLK
jgi:hypothetical protein